MVNFGAYADMSGAVCVETPVIPLEFLNTFGNILVVFDLYAYPLFQLNFTFCSTLE